jgi:hypothetical protein
MPDKSLFRRLEARYGDNWFTYQPPGARPIISVENFLRGNTQANRENISTHCNIQAAENEVLVIESYGINAWATVINPYWAGFAPVRLPEAYFQGAFRWSPRANAQPVEQIQTLLDNLKVGFLYNHNPPLTNFVIEHEGFSLFKTYEKPRLFVNPGENFELLFATIDTDAGYDPPVAPLPTTYWFIGEVKGYRLTIPEGEHLIEEPQEEKMERWSESLASKLAQFMGIGG